MRQNQSGSNTDDQRRQLGRKQAEEHAADNVRLNWMNSARECKGSWMPSSAKDAANLGVSERSPSPFPMDHSQIATALAALATLSETPECTIPKEMRYRRKTSADRLSLLRPLRRV
jgi:hypothetical protein